MLQKVQTTYHPLPMDYNLQKMREAQLQFQEMEERKSQLTQQQSLRPSIETAPGFEDQGYITYVEDSPSPEGSEHHHRSEGYGILSAERLRGREFFSGSDYHDTEGKYNEGSEQIRGDGAQNLPAAQLITSNDKFRVSNMPYMDRSIPRLNADTSDIRRRVADSELGADYGLFDPISDPRENTQMEYHTTHAPYESEEDNVSPYDSFYSNASSSGIDFNSTFFSSDIFDRNELSSSPGATTVSGRSFSPTVQQQFDYNEMSRISHEGGHPARRHSAPASQTSRQIGLVQSMQHQQQQRNPPYSQQQYLIKQHQQHQQIAEMKRQLELKQKQQQQLQHQLRMQQQYFQQQHHSMEFARPPYGQRPSSSSNPHSAHSDGSMSSGSTLSGAYGSLMDTSSPKLRMESGYRSPMTVKYRPTTPASLESLGGATNWQGSGPPSGGNVYQHQQQQQYNPPSHSYQQPSSSGLGIGIGKMNASSSSMVGSLEGSDVIANRNPSNVMSRSSLGGTARVPPYYSSGSRPGSYHSSASTPHALYQQQLQHQQQQHKQQQQQQNPYPSSQISVQSLQAAGRELLGQRLALGQASMQGGSSFLQAANPVHPQDRMSMLSSAPSALNQKPQQGLFASKDSANAFGIRLDQAQQDSAGMMSGIPASDTSTSPSRSPSTLMMRSMQMEQSQSQLHTQPKSFFNIEYYDQHQSVARRETLQQLEPPQHHQQLSYEVTAPSHDYVDTASASSPASSESASASGPLANTSPPLQLPPSVALEELVCSCCEDILVNAAKYSLKAVELANTLRARVGMEALTLVRDRTGGLLSLLERYPYVFYVDRIPKNDCVTLVQPGKKQICTKLGGELEEGTALMDHAKLLASEYSASLQASGSHSPPRDGSVSCVLHIGNVPTNVTEAQIRRDFGEFGPIECLNIISQNNRRYAFVSFYSEEHAALAKQRLSRRPPWKGSISFARRPSSSQNSSPHMRAIGRVSSEPTLTQLDAMDSYKLERGHSQPIIPPLNLPSSNNDPLLRSTPTGQSSLSAHISRNQETSSSTDSRGGGTETPGSTSQGQPQISSPLLNSWDPFRSPLRFPTEEETLQQQLQEQQHELQQNEALKTDQVVDEAVESTSPKYDTGVMNRLCDDTFVPTQRWPSNWEVDAPFCEAIAAQIQQLGGTVAVSKLRGALRIRVGAQTNIKSVPLKALLSAYPSFFILNGNHASLSNTPNT